MLNTVLLFLARADRATIPKVASENTGGPYLIAALFCDKVLKEADGVNSLIRVVDRWNAAGNATAMPVLTIKTTLFLAFKSGIYRGTTEIKIQPISPNGKEIRPIILPVNFEGDDDRGFNIAANMAFPVSEQGVYWFEISIENQVFTRTPLRVLYQRTITGSQASPQT